MVKKVSQEDIQKVVTAIETGTAPEEIKELMDLIGLLQKFSDAFGQSAEDGKLGFEDIVYFNAFLAAVGPAFDGWDKAIEQTKKLKLDDWVLIATTLVFIGKDMFENIKKLTAKEDPAPVVHPVA